MVGALSKDGLVFVVVGFGVVDLLLAIADRTRRGN
jgi:hypothetical protein